MGYGSLKTGIKDAGMHVYLIILSIYILITNVKRLRKPSHAVPQIPPRQCCEERTLPQTTWSSTPLGKKI